MESLGPLLRAARIDRAFLAPCAVFVGSSYAHFDAQPGPGFSAHVVVSVGALAAAIGVNLVDHAWDALGAPPPDPRQPVPEVEPALDARDAAIAGGIALAAALLCGVILAFLSGSAALGWGFLAVLLGLARSAPVAGFDTLGRGLGEIANVLALGPLAALAGYASQAGEGSMGAFLAGLPAGAVAAAALYPRHFLRRDADLRHQRFTPVVVFGEEQARVGLIAGPIVAAAAIQLLVSLHEYGRWTYAAFLPLAATAFLAWRLPADCSPSEYERLDRLEVLAALAALVALAIGIRAAV
jgi:1,4-dihydroxy-2-naphthoate octaprenyltransferase